MSRREDLDKAGCLKISILLAYPGENRATTAILASMQEWYTLQEAVAKGGDTGFKGQYFSIPLGVKILFVRQDTPSVLTS